MPQRICGHCGRRCAQIHFPANPANLAQAKRRFVYQELLILQLALAVKRHAAARPSAARPPLEVSPRIDARIRRLFPFDLTAGQNEAIRQIAADMDRAIPMNRLLHGDVGSGKTVVAVYAMLLAVAHGYQAVLMAPTEVLARQHARTLAQMLGASRVRLGLLTGGVGGRERQDLEERSPPAKSMWSIGTQAIVRIGGRVRQARAGGRSTSSTNSASASGPR